MLKSQPDRYGAVAVTIHWASAIMILALMATGMMAEGADAAAKAGILRIHVPLGLAIAALTLFRIVWWVFFDRKPLPVPGAVSWQEKIARAVYGLFYLVIFGMAGSGIVLMATSGAGDILFGGSDAALPNFFDYGARIPHGIGAKLMLALLAAHVGAALYHHFIRRDGIFARMWYGPKAQHG